MMASLPPGHRAVTRGLPIVADAARRVVALGLAVLVAAAVSAVLLPVGATAQSAKSSLADPAQAEMFNRVSDRLVCQCGCSMILRVCNHFECPSAIPMRGRIEDRIRAGAGKEAIVAGFVDEYGKVVLATPPPEGINLAAWVMPGFAVLIGLFLVLYFVSSWVTKKRAAPVPATVPVDPSVASRIEEELKAMD
ncbi:MAG: cytochrome c-type biogenesis protein CcmH [Candidatus Krumholzibacteriia bacterium]